jgi:HAD domain in Swiss Army Knife RNA repair proteins
MIDRMDQPVVALDFDGVLNVFAAVLPAGFERRSLRVGFDEWPTSPFLQRHPGIGELWQIEVCVNPAHGEWINRVQARGALVVWASTWQQAAVTFINPILDIDIPVGIDVDRHPPRVGYIRDGDTMGWKRAALNDEYGRDRPLCFIDDHAEIGPAWWRTGPTLQVRTDEASGITNEQMSEVEEWLANVG